MFAAAAALGYRGPVPNFEVYTKRMVPPTTKPAMTIGKRGTVSINKAAYAALGTPDAVELLFDRADQIMGMRPVDPAANHAYRFRTTARDSGPFIITAVTFCRHYGIPTDIGHRWVAEMDEGILCVDIKTGGVEVTSNRNGHVKREDAAAVSG